MMVKGWRGHVARIDGFATKDLYQFYNVNVLKIVRKFAISDIHGCLQSFKALLNRIELQKEDELYLLGDYVDRGPDSKGVIDQIIKLRAAGHTVHCLMGNHENAMIQARTDDEVLDTWLRWGGQATLASFNIHSPFGIQDIPQQYWSFLESLEYYLEVDNYLLVHGGFNFEVKDPFGDTQAMMYIRNWYHQMNTQWLDGRIIVHGHTPTEKTTIKERRRYLEFSPALGIDNGCGFLDRPDHGRLCAFELNSRELYFQPNVEAISFSY